MPTDSPPTIDAAAAARWQRIAPAASPWLHEEVARRMEDRLQWIKRAPRSWVHWGALRGGLQAHRLLAERYPQAPCTVVESDPAQARAALAALTPAWWRPQRWLGARLGLEPPAPGSTGMLWANMALHMAPEPQSLIGQWHRALAPEGFLMFSCLGPDSLREVSALYAALGWPPAHHEFTDMHDWGDMLVNAGFAEPVMDMERITLSFETPQRLLQELRELGRNLHGARFGALRGRAWRAQLHEALAARLAKQQEGGRLVLSFEIIYGHAFKPVPRPRLASETTLSLDEMRQALQQGRRAP